MVDNVAINKEHCVFSDEINNIQMYIAMAFPHNPTDDCFV